MTKGMRATFACTAHRRQLGAGVGLAHRDWIRPGMDDMGRGSERTPPEESHFRPRLLQVSQNRFACFRRQRQIGSDTGFVVPTANELSAPIKVIQTKCVISPPALRMSKATSGLRSHVFLSACNPVEPPPEPPSYPWAPKSRRNNFERVVRRCNHTGGKIAGRGPC